MGNPLATIIIPVYNVEGYLRECLDSVCGQTWKNLQIVLVDDGSTDQSGAICEEYAADSRIRVIHQPNSDAGTARNTGLDAAEGDYLYFVDSDDWIAPELVEKSLEIMETGYDLCSWGMNKVKEDGAYYVGRWRKQSFRFPSVRRKRRFLCRWYLPCRLGYEACGSVFRREAVERAGLRFANQKEIGSEDFDFKLRYLAHCESCCYLPGELYFYRQHGASIMHTHSPQEWISSILRLMRRQKAELAGTGDGLFADFYLFEGGLLLSLVGSLSARTPEGQEHLRHLAGLLHGAEEWPYLRGEAEEAAGHPGKFLEVCGLRMGSQIHGLYRYLLDGDEAAYRRSTFFNRVFVFLRNGKDRVLHG